MVTKVLYMIALGFIAAMFVGQLLNAVYNVPTDYPTYPIDSTQSTGDQGLTAEQQAKLDQYNTDLITYNDKTNKYSQNSTTILIALSLALLIIGLLLVKRSELVANGLLLGGVVTLYDASRSYGFYSMPYTLTKLILIAVGFILLLVYGLIKMDRKLKAE